MNKCKQNIILHPASAMLMSVAIAMLILFLIPFLPSDSTLMAQDLDEDLEDTISDLLGEMMIYTRMLDRNSRVNNHPYEDAFEALKAIGKPALPFIAEKFESSASAGRIMLLELACDIDLLKTGTTLAMLSAQDGDWRLHKVIYERFLPYRNNTSLELFITILQSTPPGLLQQRILDTLFEWTGKSFGKDVDYWMDWWTDIKDIYDLTLIKQVSDVAAPGQLESFKDLKIVSKRVLFVIDISKSMQWGKKINFARRELTHVIENFPADVSFNIIFFAGKVHPWKHGLVPSTKKNKASAVRLIRNIALEPGTNTYGALSQAMRSSAESIYFLSDGDPTEGEITDMPLIAERIGRLNRLRRATFYCIGFFFGQPPAETGIPPTDFKKTEGFMKQLANASGGSFLSVKEE